MELLMSLAGLRLRVLHDIPALGRICAPYRIESSHTPDLTIELTTALLDAERKWTQGACVSRTQLASLALCREFCRLAVSHGVLLFHSSAISVDGGAYLFTAPSGTGKSTHTALWRQLLGARAVMINDDKPFLRREVDGWYAYGSPWMGKHGLGCPIKVSVRGICLLGRGEENRISRIDASSAVPTLFAQTQRAVDADGIRTQLHLLNDLANEIPMWRMYCNQSQDAAALAVQSMVGGNE